MKSCEVSMGIHKHYECSISLWNFANDLFKDNIMLHFLTNKPNVMYIGVCDWGEVECYKR